MPGLLQRGVSLSSSSPIPAARNRLIASFVPVPQESFQKVIQVIQPLFQERGYAPQIFIRPGIEENASTPFQLVTVNHESPFSVMLLARPLILPGERRGLTEQEIDAFVSLCGAVSVALDDLTRPRGWFMRRRSTPLATQRPTIPVFNKTREQAVNTARQYSSLVSNVTNYRTMVRVSVEGTDAEVDDVADFLDFMGFPPEPVSAGYWYDEPICATFHLKEKEAWFSLPVTARTPQPAVVYENLRDAANRLAMEFGGNVVDDDQNAGVISGWAALMEQVRLAPGDEETRELFPFSP